MHSRTKEDSHFASNKNTSHPWSSTSPNSSSFVCEKTSLLQPSPDFPMSHWTRAVRDDHGRRFPQTIAHRGYKARHPENTMCAFKAAIQGRAHALETDVHLSRDGVVVLSHDSDLLRCFGVKKKIIDCDWSELSQYRTLREPHEPMPRLLDLLEYISQPEQENIWLLLDIKLANKADDVMRLIAATINSVQPSPSRSWKDKILLGVWVPKYLPLASYYLPDFPVTHIGFSTCYARQFLAAPNVGFNILQKVLMGPIGTNFIRDVKAAGRQLLVWTVNEERMMKWSIQTEVDGVITDDPERFRKVCDEWKDEEEEIIRASVAQWLYTFWLYFVLLFLRLLLKYKFPETVEEFLRNRPRPQVPAAKSQR